MVDENLTVEMKWSNTNKRKYIERGYIFTKNGDTFLAKVKDVIELSSGAKIPIKCDYCGEIYYPTSRNYIKVVKRKEKDCCVTCKGKKIKQTVQEKYGVSNVGQLEEVREKVKNTCIEKYGTNSPLECKEIFEKTVQSFNKHFKTSNGVSDFRSIKEINDKIEKTNIERYGGISPFCSKEVRSKIMESYYKNGTCPTSNKQIQLKNIIEELYGNCELNFPCDLASLDCMTVINGIKIDVEYDGWYWHKDRQVQDRKRDYFVTSKNYKVLRILAYEDRLPTKEELTEAINFLLTTDKKFKRIELNKY